MDKKETTIKAGEILNIPSPSRLGLDFRKKVDSRFEKIDYFLFSVVLILMVMVATLIIDSFHVNSATYKEYSQKTEVVENLLTESRENKESLQSFKNCLKSGGWNKCF